MSLFNGFPSGRNCACANRKRIGREPEQKNLTKDLKKREGGEERGEKEKMEAEMNMTYNASFLDGLLVNQSIDHMVETDVAQLNPAFVHFRNESRFWVQRVSFRLISGLALYPMSQGTFFVIFYFRTKKLNLDLYVLILLNMYIVQLLRNMRTMIE